MDINTLTVSASPAKRELLAALASGDCPAYATDQDDHIVFWNSGAEMLFGKDADEVVGKLHHKVVKSRDLFRRSSRTLNVTLLLIPGKRRHLFTLVHVFAPPDGPGLRVPPALRAVPAAALPPVATNQPPLTLREKEVLRLVATGLQNKEVAKELSISSVTVRNHVQSMLVKLAVHSKLEAVSLAFRRGWVDADALPERPKPEAVREKASSTPSRFYPRPSARPAAAAWA